MASHRPLPQYALKLSKDDKKHQTSLRMKLTRFVKNASLDKVMELLRTNNFLYTHAMLKACEYGKVHVLETIALSGDIPSPMCVSFVTQLFRTAFKHNQVACITWVYNYYQESNLMRYHHIPIIQDAFVDALKKGHLETLEWIYQNKPDSCEFRYPDVLDTWSGLEWMVQHNHVLKASRQNIESWCKNAFRRRSIGVPRWLKSHGMNITSDAEMLLFVYDVLMQPLKDTVGDDVYSVILKYVK